MKFIHQMGPWLDTKEQKAVNAYLKTGGWLTEFKKTREFEKAIAKYVGCKYVSVVTNGTVALAIALMAKGVGKGDDVIVPDYTMIASANAVVLAGAKPIFVDIDPTHLCLDYDLTTRAINKKTRAIILVTINGRYPNIEKFVALAKKHRLFLLEDAAQSLGSRYRQRHLGTFGDAGILSFSAQKIITTGQGGAILTNDKKLYERILKIKDFGRKTAGVDFHETMGYNFKFTDLQAVIGIEQMKKLSWRIKRKKEMCARYAALLQGLPHVELIGTNLNNTTPWFMDILVDQNLRQPLAKFLKNHGIGTRPFYPPIHTQPPYANIKGKFPAAEEISRRGLWLPSFLLLGNTQIEFIAKTIKRFLSRYA